MTHIYLNCADRGACSYYRARLPARHCAEQLKREGIELVCSEELRSDDEFDAYIFHRVIHPPFLGHLESLKQRGKKIVIELDDDMWHVPEWNPAYRVFGEAERDALDWTLDLADEVWVSTSPLKQVVNRGEKVKVLPNLIDLNDYPQPKRHDDGKVRIAWAGSIHHDADLELVAPAVEEVIKEYGERVQFYFFGHWPESLCGWVRIKFTNVAAAVPRNDLAGSLSFVDPVPLEDYPATLCGLGADIGLCPLVDHKFNESKSGIKYWEYTLAGAATVASPLPPYSDASLVVEPGDTWAAVLRRLIDNPLQRMRAFQSARTDVLIEHSWQGVRGRHLWLDAFRGLAA